MPFWRRDEPVHKKLAKALLNAQAGGYLAHPPDLEGNVTRGEAGLHGVPRPRRWDAVVTAEAQLPGDEVHFTALPDGTLIVGEELWAVGASGIQVASVTEEIAGDAIELAVRGGERSLLVDGMRTFGTVPSLEALGRDLAAYVIHAERLDGELWEVRLAPL